MPRNHRPTRLPVRFTLQLPADQDQAIDALAQRRRVSKAVIVREAVDRLIDTDHAPLVHAS